MLSVPDGGMLSVPDGWIPSVVPCSAGSPMPASVWPSGLVFCVSLPIQYHVFLPKILSITSTICTL